MIIIIILYILECIRFFKELLFKLKYLIQYLNVIKKKSYLILSIFTLFVLGLWALCILAWMWVWFLGEVCSNFFPYETMKNTWHGFRPQIALFSENDFYEQHEFFLLHYQIVLVRELVQHLV